jgi:hypothetical protein
MRAPELTVGSKLHTSYNTFTQQDLPEPNGRRIPHPRSEKKDKEKAGNKTGNRTKATER